MIIVIVPLSSNRLIRPTITVAMSEDVISPEPIATESHNNNGRFGDTWQQKHVGAAKNAFKSRASHAMERCSIRSKQTQVHAAE
jgi:hypothetical protein